MASNENDDSTRTDFLYPTEEYEACNIIDLFLTVWYPVIDRYYDLLTATSLKDAENCRKQFNTALTSLESNFNDTHNKYAKEGDFLLGQHFSLAECICAPWVQRFYVTLPYFRGIDFEKEIASQDRLLRWTKAVCERPSVIASKCPEEEMIAAAKRYYVSYVSPNAIGSL
mmetsp:Transcript_22051/g.27034  ORF Transcript_22051/g.27034 Transcript_22051/m.27034 type:complete len:170 (-) Transcript_22051:72-581(-)